MTAAGLFDEPPRVDSTVDPDIRTPGQRRRDRHLAAIARGQHPLSLALRTPLPLHPDARRDGDRTDDGSPRCGSCALRALVGGNARSYPKCLAGAYETSRKAWPHERGRSHVRDDGRVPLTEHPRATRGEGTDIAAWWPACRDYRPEERPA